DHHRQDHHLPRGEEKAESADKREAAGLQQVVMVAPLGMASKHCEQRHCPGGADEQPWPEQQGPTVRLVTFPRITLIDQERCWKPQGAPPIYPPMKVCAAYLTTRQHE